jgi:hypothetical protein
MIAPENFSVDAQLSTLLSHLRLYNFMSKSTCLVQGTDWGSEGYFYVSQQGGGDWGLFGILGEGVMALKAENVTGEVVETSSSPPSRFAAKTGWMKSSSWHALAVAFFASYCGALLLLSY